MYNKCILIKIKSILFLLAITFSQQTKAYKLAIISEYKEIKIYDTYNGNCLQTIKPLAAQFIELVSISPDGKYFATASTSGYIKIWSMDEKTQKIKTIEPTTPEPLHFYLSFSQDGKYLYVITKKDDGKMEPAVTIKIIDTITWQILKEYTKNLSEFNYLNTAISPDNKYIALGGGAYGTGQLVVLNALSGEMLLKRQSYSTGNIYALAFDKDSKYLALGGGKNYKGIIEIINTEKWTTEKTLSQEGTTVDALDFSPTKNLLVTTTCPGAGGDKLMIFNTLNWKLENKERVNPASSSLLKFSADSENIVRLGAYCTTIKIYDAHSLNLKKEIEIDMKATGMAILP